jgi:ferric iron reductase protein FhuF
MSYEEPTFSDIARAGQTVSLTDAEKQRMKVYVYAHVQAEKKRRTNIFSHRSPSTLNPSPYTFPRFVFMHKAVAFVLIALFATTSVGGATTYAQSAVPGESLYSLKTLTEHIRESLVVSDEDALAVASDHAARRVHEASVLRMRGTMTEEHKNMLSQSLQKSIETIVGTGRSVSRSNPVVVVEAYALMQGYAQMYRSITDGAQTEDTIEVTMNTFLDSEYPVVLSSLFAVSHDSIYRILVTTVRSMTQAVSSNDDALTDIAVETSVVDLQDDSLPESVRNIISLDRLSEVEGYAALERVENNIES